jgi:hypothetical protein
LLGIGEGATSGNPVGYAKAAIGSAQLANKAGAFGAGGAGSISSNVGTGLSAAGSVIGIYGGLKQGGVAGDTQAALSAAQLGGTIATAAGATGLGTTLAAAGPIGLALAPALYGMSTPAVQLGQKYWTGVQSSLQQAIDSGDKGQIAQQVNGLLGQPQNTIPSNIQQLVYSTGMVPSIGWGQQYVQNQFQQAGNFISQSGASTGKNSKGIGKD